MQPHTCACTHGDLTLSGSWDLACAVKRHTHAHLKPLTNPCLDFYANFCSVFVLCVCECACACVRACVSLEVLRVSQLSLGATEGVQSYSSGLLALRPASAAFLPTCLRIQQQLNRLHFKTLQQQVHRQITWNLEVPNFWVIPNFSFFLFGCRGCVNAPFGHLLDCMILMLSYWTEGETKFCIPAALRPLSLLVLNLQNELWDSLVLFVNGSYTASEMLWLVAGDGHLAGLSWKLRQFGGTKAVGSGAQRP